MTHMLRRNRVIDHDRRTAVFDSHAESREGSGTRLPAGETNRVGFEDSRTSPFKTGLFSLFLAAVVALGSGGSSSAQELVAGSPGPSLQEKWLEARGVFHQTWFERADDLFGGLVAESPGFALAYGYLAVIDAMLYRDAEPNATRALALAESAPKGEDLMTRSLVAFARGDLESCEDSLRSFLELYPDDRYARHVLGFTLIDQDRPEEGVEVLEALVEAHPSYTAAYNHIGYGLAALGRTAEVLPAFESFLAGDTGNPSAHDSLADGLARVNETDAAIAHLTRALLLEPRFAYAWKHMGDVLGDRGETALAASAYRRALETAAKYGPDFSAAVRRRLDGEP